MQENSEYLFSKKSEYTLNIISMILLGLCMIDIIFKGILSKSLTNAVLAPIAAYIFFNMLHVPTTLLNLFLLPEFKLWLQHKKSVFKSFKIEFFLAFIFFIVVSYFGYKRGGYETPYAIENAELLFYTTLLSLLLTTMHNIGQTFGLSMILHKNNPPIVSLADHRAEYAEKKLFQFFMVTHSINLFHFYFKDSIFIDIEKYSLTYYLLKVIFALSVIFSILILINAFRYSKNIRVRKFTFLTRLLSMPLLFVTPMAEFMLRSNHGLEYTLFTVHIMKKSENSVRKKKVIYFLTIFICAIWGVFVTTWFYDLDAQIPSKLILPLQALLNAVILMHFWLDRLIYRFQNAESRKYILPLLKS